MTVATPTTGVATARRTDTRRPSRASTRSLQFAGLVITVDVVLAAASVAALYFLADPAHLGTVAVFFDGTKFAVVGTLAVVAVRWGIVGLRETASGQLTRRRWAIAGIVIAGFFGVLVASSFVATAVFVLGQ